MAYGTTSYGTGEYGGGGLVRLRVTGALLAVSDLAPWDDTDQLVIIQVSVYSPEGIWLADLANSLTNTSVVTTGSISVDETRQVRRTLSLSIACEATDTTDLSGLVPSKAGDLLHPVTNNELRVFRGWQFKDGETLLYPLGVFRTSKPEVDDTGSSLTIALTGNDRSSVISRQVWQSPYAITDGTLITTAVQALINNRWPAALPALSFNLAPTLLVVPATVFGADLSSGSNDPWADALTLAAAAGMELFFDVNGVVVMRPIPDPTIAPVVADYVEGKNASFPSVARVLDETTTYNGVIYIGTGVSGAPVQGSAWDTDPTSPTYYLGDWGQTPLILTTSLVPVPGQSTAAAQAQLTVMAQAQLQLVMGAFDNTSFEAVPNPSLTEGDCVQLVRARAAIDNAYVVSAMTMPLDVGSLMSVTNRPRRQTT